jgi:hypothetical protein
MEPEAEAPGPVMEPEAEAPGACNGTGSGSARGL